MSLPRPASPSALIADLRAFARERSRVQWAAAFVAVAMPTAIVVGFIVDGRDNTLPGEQIVYVSSWPADRSDAEIKAAQKKDQAVRDAAKAEKQRQYREIARKLGIE